MRKQMFWGMALLCLFGLATVAGAATTTLVSVATEGPGANGDSGAYFPSRLSASGRYVVFNSKASNLVTPPVPLTTFDQVYFRDLETGVTELVSVSTEGVPGNDSSTVATVSDDGRFVAFHSKSTNLVAADTNGWTDIFVRDRQSGSTRRINVSNLGQEADGISTYPSISADGRFVVFQSSARNLILPGNQSNTYLYIVNLENDTIDYALKKNGLGLPLQGTRNASLSGNGRFVVYVYQDHHVYVYDRYLMTTNLISKNSSGVPGNYNSNSSSQIGPYITRDGRFVSFSSGSTNLIEGVTTGWNIYVHDRETGETKIGSVDSSGQPLGVDMANSTYSMVSSDGRYVAFTSGQAYIHDLENGETWGVGYSDQGILANASTSFHSMSQEGLKILFGSGATNLVIGGDTNGKGDLFLRSLDICH